MRLLLIDMHYLYQFFILLKYHKIPFIVLILLTTPLLIPLFFQGVLKTDDGDWMIIRFSAFYEALRDGQIPVRWVTRLNDGLGYPVINFLYPGYLYLSTPFYILTRSYVLSIELFIASSLVFSGIGMYLWLSQLFNKFTSVLGALFYLYVPYHVYDYLKRGSVGELASLAFIPILLYFVENKSFFGIAFGTFLLLLSHNTLAVMFIPLIMIYQFVRFKSIEQSIPMFLGIGMATFFWLPALYDLQFTVFATTEVANFQEYITPLHLVGIPLLAAVVFGGYSIFKLKWKDKKYNVALFSIFLCVGSLFFSSEYSFFLWDELPMQFIQFPFRFLSVGILFGSFLFALWLHKYTRVIQIGLLFITLLLGFTFGLEYYTPIFEKEKTDDYFATNQASTTIQNEYLPIDAKASNPQSFSKIAVIENGKISNIVKESNLISFHVTANEAGKGTLSQLYFPGWIAEIDGNETTILVEKDSGLMSIYVPKGEHNVTFKWRETPLRTFADVTSIMSLGIVSILALKRKKK